MNTAIVTTHAFKRGRERLSLSTPAMQRTAERAFMEGFTRDDSAGRLRAYADERMRDSEEGSNLRFYGEHLYIFVGSKLVTVYKVPASLHNHLAKLRRQRKAAQ